MGNYLPRVAHGVERKKLPRVEQRGGTRRGTPVRRDNKGEKAEEGWKDFLDPCMVEGARGKGSVVRVKIVVTKEAAARLLAASGGSSEKMMEHVASELRKMDGGELGGVVGLGPRDHHRWRPALRRIPESPLEA